MLASLGNLFGLDTLIIFLVILLLFGARKLPSLFRGEEEEETRQAPWQWLDVLAIISLVFAGMLWLVLLTP